jgi:hypothetical protein
MKRITSLLLLPAAVFLLYACKKNKDSAPAPEPIAVYEFNNNPFNTASAYFHGSVVGTLSITTDSFNTPQSAYKFPGNGYIKIPHSDILAFPGNEFTLSLWINPTINKQAYLMIKGNAAGNLVSYGFDIMPGVVHGYIYSTTGELFSAQGTSEIIKNAWQHLVVTFSTDKLAVYYNGKSEGSIAVDRPMEMTDGPLSIGTYIPFFPDATFTGKMDQVRLYNKALTAAQVNDLYKNYK